MKIKATLIWLFFLQLTDAFGYGYGSGDFDSWYQPVPHRPVDIITDVVNDLGVRILQQYTAHGNVAFSPMGVGFVLAALYEGSTGRSSHQIWEALGLPRDRDITRIGFREIHQRLGTYLNADGFLGGLTLNQENTRLRLEYEDVLRFYGFDLSIDEEVNNTSSTPEVTTPSTSGEQSTADFNAILDTSATTMPSTTAELIDGRDSSSAVEGSTTLSTSTISTVEMAATTLSTVDMQDKPTRSTTVANIPIQDEMTVNDQTTADQTSKMAGSLNTVPITEVPSFTPGTLTTITSATNTKSSMAENNTTSTSSTSDVTVTIGAENSGITSTTVVEEKENADESDTSTSTSTTLIENSTGTVETPSGMSDVRMESTTTSSTMNGMMEAATPMEEASTILSSDSASINATQSSSTSIDNSEQPTASPPADENTVSTDLSVNETILGVRSTEIDSTDSPSTTTMIGTTMEDPEKTSSLSPNDDSTNRVRKRSIRSPRGYFSSYPDEGIWMQDLGIWKPYSSSLSEASVRDSTEISFLVNGCDISSISATRYIAVLPFAYFPSLHAVALEFPLDDPRYNILLLMSTNRRDTYRLARDLGGKSLRLLRKQLQPTWVRATIPSFMLRGFVTLTSFLQRLGILDVFEPRAADLSPMTPDLGVYVRDIQQSIGVNIRNYMKPDRTHSRNGLFERAGPVPFTAVHPFLYFIVDAETSVALIAGRVNDPLNSRIL